MATRCKYAEKGGYTVFRLIRSRVYVILHSRGALLLLAVGLFFTFMSFYSSRADFRDAWDLQRRIREAEEKGADGLAIIQNNHDLPGMEDLEEIAVILRRRQVIAAPNAAIDGIYGMILFLPGFALSPGLTRRRGIGRELRTWGRVRPLLSRMLSGWVFCLLLSTGLYLLYLRQYVDVSAAAPGQLLRNYATVQFFTLSCLCYSYFVYVLLRRAWLAIPAMLLPEILLHQIVPGLRVFYPMFIFPTFNEAAHQNTTSLVGADCPPETFFAYCGVCLIYVIVCVPLSVLIFRRRELQ